MFGWPPPRAERLGYIGTVDEQSSAIGLLHQPSAQSCKFGIADRPCLFQPTELIDFIRGAETNDLPELIALLLCLLHVTLRHASSLKDEVCKHDNEWKYYPSNHPCCLGPAGDIVATEQIGSNSNE